MTQRFVLDTNVLVDALCFPRSFGRRALLQVQAIGTLIWSAETMTELIDVINRPRLARYVDADVRQSYVRWLAQNNLRCDPTERIAACRDPKDAKFLELAVAGAADAIISRDRDLLILSPFRGIEVVEPQAFVERSSAP